VAEVLAASAWPTNAHLVVDLRVLGYLRDEWLTLDPTHGLGTFWKLWQPRRLVACDLDPAKSPVGKSVDFCDLPWPDGHFDSVVLDGPYKLNGTPTEDVDARYGVHRVATWRDRMDLIRRGISECSRVLGAGYLLVKCQDQVCSGKVRWQTDEFTEHARSVGLRKVDRLDMLGGRQQPGDRRQVHARRNHSTMLVFRRSR
jgi:hypothetical protein